MTAKFARVGLIVGLVSVLSACTLPRGAALQSEITGKANQPDADFAVEEVTRASLSRFAKWPVTGWHGHYHWFVAPSGPNSNLIEVGDRLNLTIWDNQQNSLITSPNQTNTQIADLVVSASGTVFVPYVGDVRIRGLTTPLARKKIEEDLLSIVPNAQVVLNVVTGTNNSVDLVGGVNTPGNFALPDRNYTMLSLLAAGGGISANLSNPIVALLRGGATYKIPADTLFADGRKNVVLRGGDKVVVQEDDRYFVGFGSTGTEELVYFTKEHISAIEALSMLGGINDTRANPQGILILREYNSSGDGDYAPTHRQVVFTLDLTTADGLFAARKFQINPSDTVMATESPIQAAQTIFTLFGSALGIGNNI